MSKLENMRGIEIAPFRAVSSGPQTLEQLFGEGGFSQWIDTHRALVQHHPYEPVEFLWHEGPKETWGHGQNLLIAALRDGVGAAEVAPYALFDFPGGLFLVATADENDPADLEETVSAMMRWIEASPVFEYGDFPASGMCNMPNPDGAFDLSLGIAQQQIYLPLKKRRNTADTGR